MANKKISELTNINNPSLSSITPVVVNNITYKTSLQNLRQVLVDSGSHNFTGSQTINGNLVVSGSLTAQQYIISSSYINIITENISGSTSFGNTNDDTHKFTGSVFVEGNLNLTGTGSMKNLIVGFGEFNQSNPEVLHVESSGSFNIVDLKGDFEAYTQINLKNKNSGSTASGDIVITADNGTEEIHYVDLGINSSTYNAGYVGYDNDAYLINAGKDLYLGTIGGIEEHPSKVHIFTNNSWENSQIVLSPTKEISFNTGSVTTGFTYEFSGSLKLKNELKVDGSVTASYFIGDGSQLTNLPTQSLTDFATTGSNEFYGNQIVYGDQIIVGNIESQYTVTTQYLYAPTSSQQIIIYGDPYKDTLIGVYAGDDIELILIEVEGVIWEFQKNGKMKFPDGTYQSTAFTTQSINSLSLQTSSYATTGSNSFNGSQNITGSLIVSEFIETTNIQGTGSLYLKPDLNDSRDFVIYNTAPSDVHIKGNASYSFFGDDTNYLKIDNSISTITIKSTSGATIDTLLNIKSVSEEVTVDSGFGGNRDFDYTSGSIFYLTGITGNGIWNINNIPTTDNKGVTITFLIEQGVTPYSASAFTFDSSAVTVKWADSTIPTGSANKTEIIGLTAFRVGSSWNVLGSLSSFGN
jgi:hypothetical protein